MKKKMKQFWAGILTMALVIGMFAGAGTMKAEAAVEELPKTLTVKVVKEVDGVQVAVSGVSLVLVSSYCSSDDRIFSSKTDENGIATHTVSDEMEEYTLTVASDSGYICESPISVTMGEENFEPYIEYVGDDEYAGDEIVLVVKEKDPEPIISSVKADESVSKDASFVSVTVEGENLPDIMYYKLAYKYMDEYGDITTKTLDWSGKEIVVTGDASMRTISVPVNYTKYSDALEWVINVAASQSGSYNKVNVKIEGTEAKVAKITQVTTSKTSVSAEGETISATITGENLPDTVYYKIFYSWEFAGNPVDTQYGVATSVAGESDTNKTFEVTIPAKKSANDGDIMGWKVGAALTANASGSAWIKSEFITIEEETPTPGDAVTEETKAALEEAIAGADDLTEAEYTAESWQAYNKAIEEAKALQKKEEATETEYQEAIQAISNAKDMLEKIVIAEPKIVKISAADSVSKEDTTVNVTVEGENLPDTMYYKLAYKYMDEYGDIMTKTLDWSGKEIVVTGDASMRTISVPVDYTKYSDALEWVINVAVSQSGSYNKVNVKIEGTEAKVAKITQVNVSKTSVSSEGETITATIIGENLPDTVYGKLYYSVKMGDASVDISYGDILSSTEGNDTEKTFKVAIPAKSDVADDIEGWKFAAALLRNVTYTKSELITINETTSDDTVTEETKTVLNTAIAEASSLKEADYTAESWKAYAEAIAAANELTNKENATETEYQEAIQAINNAKAALKEVEKTEEKPTEQPVVKDVKMSKITLSGISKKIAAGKKIQLTAAVAPSNASNKAVTWKTSNKKYATVSSTGKVNVKKAGAGKTVTITATAKDGSGVKATYKIKIMKNAVKSIKLKAAKSVKAGKSLKVKATVKTTGKKVNKTLKWTSSNTKYATVNSKGKVTAKKAGKGKTVKITAKSTDGTNKKKTVKIKIK